MTMVRWSKVGLGSARVRIQPNELEGNGSLLEQPSTGCSTQRNLLSMTDTSYTQLTRDSLGCLTSSLHLGVSALKRILQ